MAGRPGPSRGQAYGQKLPQELRPGAGGAALRSIAFSRFNLAQPGGAGMLRGMLENTEKRVLIAEDDPNEAFFLLRAFQQAEIPNACVVVKNGLEAIERLREPSTAAQWCLVITDLKMPGVDGFQLLEWISQQKHLREMPVVVLSASCNTEDICRCVESGARDYLIKPNGLAELMALVKGLHVKWVIPHCGEPEPVAAP